MRRWINSGIILAMLGILAVAASFRQWHAPYVAQERSLVIASGQGTRAVLRQLAEADALPPLWQIAPPLVLDGRARHLKAGEYAFAAGMTAAQVIDKIARGQVVIHKLSIPEGWNIFQVRDALLNEPLLTGELPPMVEGSLFPDTMLFQRGQSRASLIAQMQQRQREILAREWAARAENLRLPSPEAALILASVIEKETGVADERAMVASVFYNRLKLGMKLQSDPTVAYGILAAQQLPTLGRALTRADLQTDTPHNSYTRAGLPPTPICNPGLAAIQAALHPASSDALYFVATGHGGHAFANSLTAHNANVASYRAAVGP